MSGSAARAPLVAIDQVATLLAGRALQLAQELLPGGKRDGHEWRAGSLAGEPGQSLGVHLSGVKAGVWCDFSTGETGDALDLVAQVLFHGDKGEALRWARRWLGLESGDPAVLATARRRAEKRRDEVDAQAAEDEARRKKGALAMWLGAGDLAGSPAEAYLAARGIDLAQLGLRPRALRFHPALFCREAGASLPAMVAAIGDMSGQHVATHRTFLGRDEAGLWRKAKLAEPKLTYGSYSGGFIRLSRGASARPWRDVRGGETVAFAEGIENALAVALLVPEWRVGAAVSLGNLGRLKLPDSIRDVVVCADNDAPNSPAVVGLKRALDYLLSTGARVRVARPDPGVKDWNDQLLAERAC